MGLGLPGCVPGVRWPVLPLWHLTRQLCLLLTCRPSEDASVGDVESLWDTLRVLPLLSLLPWTASCPRGASTPSLLVLLHLGAPLPYLIPPGFNPERLSSLFFSPFSFLLPSLPSFLLHFPPLASTFIPFPLSVTWAVFSLSAPSLPPPSWFPSPASPDCRVHPIPEDRRSALKPPPPS